MRNIINGCITLLSILIIFVFIFFKVPLFQLTNELIDKNYHDEIIELSHEYDLSKSDAILMFKQELYIQSGLILDDESYYEKYGLPTSYYEEYVSEETKNLDKGISLMRMTKFLNGSKTYNKKLWNSLDGNIFTKTFKYLKIFWNPIYAILIAISVCLTLAILVLTILKFFFIANKKFNRVITYLTYVPLLLIFIALIFSKIPNETINPDKAHGLYVITMLFNVCLKKTGFYLIVSMLFAYSLINPVYSLFKKTNKKSLIFNSLFIVLNCALFLIIII